VQYKFAKPLALCKFLLETVGNYNASEPPLMSRLEEVKKGKISASAVQEQIAARPWLLDAGCGSGSFACAARLMDGCFNTHSYDNRDEMVDIAKSRIRGDIQALADELQKGAIAGNITLLVSFDFRCFLIEKIRVINAGREDRQTESLSYFVFLFSFNRDRPNEDV
jgi:hypothetical protein